MFSIVLALYKETYGSQKSGEQEREKMRKIAKLIKQQEGSSVDAQ